LSPPPRGPNSINFAGPGVQPKAVKAASVFVRLEELHRFIRAPVRDQQDAERHLDRLRGEITEQHARLVPTLRRHIDFRALNETFQGQMRRTGIRAAKHETESQVKWSVVSRRIIGSLGAPHQLLEIFLVLG
jgi:hypothetical protein